MMAGIECSCMKSALKPEDPDRASTRLLPGGRSPEYPSSQPVATYGPVCHATYAHAYTHAIVQHATIGGFLVDVPDCP